MNEEPHHRLNSSSSSFAKNRALTALDAASPKFADSKSSDFGNDVSGGVKYLL